MKWRCMCLVIHAPEDLRLEERDAGEIGPGQVLVRVGMGGICGSDLHYFHDGGFGTVRIQEPLILGHEVAGTVAAVAADVTSVKVGDRVAVNPSRPCTACKFCLEGLPNQCLEMRFFGSAMRMPHVQGAFRNVLLCQAEQCHKVADGVPLTLAALAEPFSVGLHAVSRAGSLLGKRVLVSGCGPIGVLTIAAARLHGAAQIVATDVVDEPLAIARQMGADEVINAATDSGWVARYSPDKGTFDVLLECSGNQRALRDGFTASELAEAQRGMLNFRRLTRAQDATLAGTWAANLELDRSFARSAEVDAAISRLTLAQVNAALRRYIDPARIAIVFAGDFR